MKNINNNHLINFVKSKALMLIASSSLLSSCVIYTGGYSETDGVYYDPNRDSLPAGTYSNGSNQVDGYYNYQDTYPSIYDNNQQNIQDQQSRYTLRSDSDWGNFTGTETNYSSFNNWGYGGWGMGFGWGGGFGGWGYPGYGMYGWNSPFNSWGWGMGFGWGNSFYSPWGWGGGFYDPFWGAGYGYGGWGHGFYGGNTYINYGRSGANGGRLNGMISQNRLGNRTAGRFSGINSTGFRPNRDIRNDIGTRNSGMSTQNNGFRNSNNGMRNFPNDGGMRTGGIRQNYPNNGNIRNTPNYPNNGGIRSTPNNGGTRTSPNNNGFRNDSFSSPSRSGSSGGFNSGGGMRSGGSSGGGGGMRSGGGGGRR